MNHVYLCHGIRTDGRFNIGRLVRPLSRLGHRVVDTEMPIRRTWHVWRSLNKDADTLIKAIERDRESSIKEGDSVTVIGHSYGGGIVLRAAERHAFDLVWLFNPAVSASYDLSNLNLNLLDVYCIYSQSDWPVRLSSYIPWHPFGRAGAVGLKNLPETNNIEISGGHVESFREPALTFWAQRIHDTGKYSPPDPPKEAPAGVLAVKEADNAS